MALNETQRRNLAKLDVMDGTGIFTNNTKVDSVDQPTVIISLGGLGGKTLNELKKQIMRRVNKENNSIRLLAIDSDEKSLSQFENLQQEEKLSLYEPSIAAMLASPENIPAHIKAWLNEKADVKLSGEGCGAKRQNGRFILSVSSVYEKVRKRIKDTILDARNAAPTGRTNIIFVAGISGGTGSGTFIDIAYLVRDIMRVDIGAASPQSYKMSAYLYMPDVQFGCGADQNALQANGYAALKELDYFYNLKKYDGVYRWPFSPDSTKDSTENIYDFCTLISSLQAGGVVAGNRENVAISVAVESLMAIITNAELVNEHGQPEQILTSFLDNYERNIDMWMITGQGSAAGVYPRSANYCYNVVGYGSARIPVDAIMSYIALKMYDNVLGEYHNMSFLTTDYVSRIMASSGVADFGSILAAVKAAAQSAYVPRDLPSGGDIRSLKQPYRIWRDNAVAHYQTFKNTQQFTTAINKVTDQIISQLDTNLNTAFGEHGPYFVVKTITASQAADGIDGIIRRIDGLTQAMLNEYSDRKQRCDQVGRLIDWLDTQAREIPAILGIVKQEDRDAYIVLARNTIEMYTLDMDILAAMTKKLAEVRDYVVTNNNKVFDVYTNVLDYIKNILSKNSDLVVKSNISTNSNGGTTYSLDVVNLDSAQEHGRRLKSCLDSFLTPEFLARFGDRFKELLRDPNNRPAFTDNTDKFDATKLIQHLFDDLLGAFYQEAVERFLIAYYSESSDMDNIQKLDSVMNNDAEKEAALRIAAEAICKELSGSARPLCQILGGAIESFAPPQRYMCVPTVLYDVFKPIAQPFFGSIKLCKRDNAFSIDVVTNHIGIPLTKIHGINDADKAYDANITKNVPGLHLDENPQSDFTMLPAPFIYEMWKSVNHSCRTESNNMKKVKDLTDRLIALGLLADDKDAANKSTNLRLKLYFDTEIGDELIKKLDEQAKYDVNIATVPADYITAFLLSNGVEITELPIKINQKGIEQSMENLNLIVRKNIVLYRKLKAFLDKYEKLNDVIEKYVGTGKDEAVFNEGITAFTNLIKAGLISYNPNVRCWNYSDGIMEKPLYNFSMKGPFEKVYNLFFAYAEYNKLDDRMKASLNDLMIERFNNQQISFVMPEAIEADINKLYSAGAKPDSINYLLDREMNRRGVNQAAAQFGVQFGIPLPQHNDNFEVLYKFYEAFKMNFN